MGRVDKEEQCDDDACSTALRSTLQGKKATLGGALINEFQRSSCIGLFTTAR